MAWPDKVTAVGAPGIPGMPGTISFDAADKEDVPPTLVAVEVNVYAVPLVSPVTTHEVAGDVTVHVAPPGYAVTW